MPLHGKGIVASTVAQPGRLAADHITKCKLSVGVQQQIRELIM